MAYRSCYREALLRANARRLDAVATVDATIPARKGKTKPRLIAGQGRFGTSSVGINGVAGNLCTTAAAGVSLTARSLCYNP